MFGPTSMYSLRWIHIALNVAREARIEPPIHVKNWRFGGALIRILMSPYDACVAVLRTSARSRSPNRGNLGREGREEMWVWGGVVGKRVRNVGQY